MFAMKPHTIVKLIVCLFAGALGVFAFAPFYLPWLAPVALVPLMFCLRKSSRWQSFFQGFFFGLGFFGFGVSWLFISIHRFGPAGIPLSLLLTSLFVVTLSLFPAINAYLFTRIFPRDTHYKWLIVFPASWTLFEWVRSWIFTGFPWLLLGYSQTNSWLKGFAPVVGIYGVTFLIVLSAALIFLLLMRRWRVKFFCLIALIVIWFTGFGLAQIHWTTPTGKTLKVSLIQGNIPQETKWQPEVVQMSMNRYLRLTKTQWKSDLIVWPEAAVALPLPESKPYINSLNKLARQNNSSIILGVPIQANENGYYNAAIAIGESKGQYDKQHLVPFGEYVPLEKLFSTLFRLFNFPMSEIITNPKTSLWLTVNNISIAPFICYEVAFERFVRKALPKAKILLTITDDAWFGKSIAGMQHLQIGQMRSLEAGRFMLFVGNTGITAIITPQGCLSHVAVPFQTKILNGEVIAMQGSTPWILFGSWPLIILLFIFIIIGFKFR